MRYPQRRLVIVVRADPVICGHSGEARNLAEVALTERLRRRPAADVADRHAPGRRAAAQAARPAAALQPGDHGRAPRARRRLPRPGRAAPGRAHRPAGGAARGARADDLSRDVPGAARRTSSSTPCGRPARPASTPTSTRSPRRWARTSLTSSQNCLREGRFGAAAYLLTTFLAHDEVVAVSDYTRDEIVLAAEAVDLHCGTRFAPECRDRVTVSYPPIDTSAYVEADPAAVDAALARRGLERDGYVLFLSRVTRAKGIHDLIEAYAGSRARDRVKLVDRRHRHGAGGGPGAGRAPRIDDRDRLPHRRRRRREAAAHARLRGLRPADQARAGLRRDVRHRAGREDARRRRPGDHHDDRRDRARPSATPR